MSSAITLGAVTLRDRSFGSVLDAARSAGFTSIGLTVGQCLSAVERGVPLDRIPEILRDAGLAVAELELVRLGEAGPVRHANALVEDLALSFQPDRLHAAAFMASTASSEEFATLCSRLGHIQVALEFMPYSAVPDLAAARAFIAEVAQPNAKIVLDAVHFFRSGGRVEQLTAQALAEVAVVQLSDVVDRYQTDVAEEARHLRTYPGAGSLDLVGFIRAIALVRRELPPLSIEPISDALELLPIAVVADSTMVSTLRVLKQAGLLRGADGRYRAQIEKEEQ